MIFLKNKKLLIVRNLNYDSKFKDGTLDIIYFAPDAPTIFWIHGGAFVGGDNSGVEKYAMYIAAEGYNVVNMNYARPPEVNYPVPLLQIQEAYQCYKPF